MNYLNQDCLFLAPPMTVFEITNQVGLICFVLFNLDPPQILLDFNWDYVDL